MDIFVFMASVVLIIWVIRILRIPFRLPTPQKQREEASQIYDKRFFTGEETAKKQIEDYFKKIKTSQGWLAIEFFTFIIFVIVISYASGHLSVLNIIFILFGFGEGLFMIVTMFISSGAVRNNILGGFDLGKFLDD